MINVITFHKNGLIHVLECLEVYHNIFTDEVSLIFDLEYAKKLGMYIFEEEEKIKVTRLKREDYKSILVDGQEILIYGKIRRTIMKLIAKRKFFL